MKWVTVSLPNVFLVLIDLTLIRLIIKLQQVNITVDQYKLFIYEKGGGQNENIINAQQNSVFPRRKIEENCPLPPPEFSLEHKRLVIDSWQYVESHVTEVIQYIVSDS